MRFPAVLFDLDGTLLDTLADLADSMNAVLADWGLSTHPLEAYRWFVGDGIHNLARRALPASHSDEAVIARCVGAMQEEYGRRWSVKTRPYEGIVTLLDGLAARRVRLAVLSNKPHAFTLQTVAALLPDWRFEVVLGARAGVPVKPDPIGALEVAARLGLPPERILYLGDTATDMLTARAAGMHPVGAGWGFREPEELLAAGAAHLLATPTELLDLL